MTGLERDAELDTLLEPLRHGGKPKPDELAKWLAAAEGARRFSRGRRLRLWASLAAAMLLGLIAGSVIFGRILRPPPPTPCGFAQAAVDATVVHLYAKSE